jgi:hypothetical protein
MSIQIEERIRDFICGFLQAQKMRHSKMADSAMTLQCYSAEIGMTRQAIGVKEFI